MTKKGIILAGGTGTPSARGELEITDLNNSYLQDGQLEVRLLGRGFGWLDTGTPASLLEAGNFIATIEHRQNLKVACLEEVAWNRGFIDRPAFEKLIAGSRNPEYRRYLEACWPPVCRLKRSPPPSHASLSIAPPLCLRPSGLQDNTHGRRRTDDHRPGHQ